MDEPRSKIQQVISRWRSSRWAARSLAHHEVLPPSPARSGAFPADLDPRLVAALRARGVGALFAHQLRALDLCRRGHDLVVATPTASGKTLCYNLPVLQALLADPAARALYLFPTKALARDQVEAVRGLVQGAGDPCGQLPDVGVAVYDGDTPPDQRRAARRRARILATNPDMLHAGILPNHPRWAEFFSGLTHVVVDELHTYRGVFGSHVANVLRRLDRVARFHGAAPRFVATSATIANPAELAGALFGRPARLVEQSGAPSGERNFFIYNPPLLDPALGLRESYMRAACRLTRDLVQAGVGTLVFCRSRLAVEVMVRQLRDALARLEPRGSRTRDERVRGYRGGYLPGRRREIEVALRQGRTDVVVATSALELGIDIGSLDAVVLAGWPGSRAAAWQRAGRAGRRLEPSLAVLVASSEPVDQYVAGNPGYLFGQAPEHCRVNGENPAILVPQLKCAAAELPFAQGEGYGPLAGAETDGVLGVLAEAGLLHPSGGGFHYVGHPYPAAEVSLRGPMDQNFLVVRHPEGDVLAEVNYDDVPLVLYEGAIYQLEGRQYQVRRLDHEGARAWVVPAPVDYFTDAMTHDRVRVLERLEGDAVASTGEVHVVTRVVGYKKIKLHSHENLGYGDVDLPEREKHTTALWLQVPAARLPAWASPGQVAEAALGAARALHSAATLVLMGDSGDLGRAVGDARSGWFAVQPHKGSRGRFTTPGDGSELDRPEVPTLFLFDRYPGGTGLCDRLYDLRRRLLVHTLGMVRGCACRAGCPACVGPGGGPGVKELAGAMLELLLDGVSATDSPAGESPAGEPAGDSPAKDARRTAGDEAAVATRRGPLPTSPAA